MVDSIKKDVTKGRIDFFLLIAIVLLALSVVALVQSQSTPRNLEQVLARTVINSQSNTSSLVYDLKARTQGDFNANTIAMPSRAFSEGSNLTASGLVKLNPRIKMVRYYDRDEKKYYNYINFREGIGRDFPIQPDEPYEVFVEQDLSLSFPVR